MFSIQKPVGFTPDDWSLLDMGSNTLKYIYKYNYSWGIKKQIQLQIHLNAKVSKILFLILLIITIIQVSENQIIYQDI